MCGVHFSFWELAALGQGAGAESSISAPQHASCAAACLCLRPKAVRLVVGLPCGLGKMASLWHCLLMLLSSLVLAGGYQLPSLRLLFQDGTPEENVAAHSLRAPSESSLDGPRRWEWRTGGDVGREFPQVSRRKREVDKVDNHSSPVEQPKENVTQPLVAAATEKSTTEGPPVETTPEDLEEAYITETESTHLNTTSSHAPGTTLSLSKTTTETASTEAGGHLVGMMVTTLSPSTSESVANGTERVNIGLVNSKVSTSSPKLEASSDVSTATLRPDSATATKNVPSSHAPVFTPRLSKTTTEIASTEAGGHLVGVMATTLSLSTSKSVANGTERVNIGLVNSKKVPTSSPKLEATSDVSTATPRPDSATATPGFKRKGAGTEALTVPKAAPTTTATIPVERPSQKPERSANILVGKCLLAIFLLALVAGIFIVLAGVLATLLWRQKRAYKVSQCNHTEMVCISSLLAAEEAEEAAGRQSKVKRMKMRAENGSETEMDNLTLNSFLPEH